MNVILCGMPPPLCLMHIQFYHSLAGYMYNGAEIFKCIAGREMLDIA